MTPSTIDSYLSTLEEPQRNVLETLRQQIKTVVPNATECISYGVPTFKLNGKNLIHFAATKKHLSLFPGPGAIAAFSEELTAFATSKGTIRFTVESPLPKSLVKKIVKHLVEETK